MKSGHASGPRWQTACAALVWGVATLYAAVAVAQPRVACVNPGNSELVARIRGQTRDLPIRLAYVDATLPASPSPEQLQALAKQQTAQLVVQVSALDSGAHAVLVYDAERDVLRKRDVPAPSRRERLSRSAAAETIALIVRGELTDALRAREPATTAEGPEAASSPDAAAANGAPSERTPDAQTARRATTEVTQPPAPPPSAAEPETPPETGGLPNTGPGWFALDSFALGVGGRVAYAARDRLFVAALVALALRFSSFSLGVSASTSLRDEALAETLALSLREHTVSAELMVRIPLSAYLELSVGPGAGVVVHQRTVTRADPSWLLSADRTHTSATLGARAELRVRIARHFGAALRVGLDYMLRPLVFQVGEQSNSAISRDISRLNDVAPWATLVLLAEL